MKLSTFSNQLTISKMKKTVFLLAVLSMCSLASFAQKYAYVDTKYILENIPDYTKAQKQLDDISAGWQKEIEKKYKDIDDMYKNYQAEQVLLTDEMKKKREQDITDKEKQVKDLQKQRFGFEGDLFKKRQELVKPIQDKVYDAITKMAQAKSLDFVFDKAGGSAGILYSKPELDKSNDIIRDMGFTPGANRANQSSSTGSSSNGSTNSKEDKAPAINKPAPVNKNVEKGGLRDAMDKKE